MRGATGIGEARARPGEKHLPGAGLEGPEGHRLGGVENDECYLALLDHHPDAGARVARVLQVDGESQPGRPPLPEAPHVPGLGLGGVPPEEVRGQPLNHLRVPPRKIHDGGAQPKVPKDGKTLGRADPLARAHHPAAQQIPAFRIEPLGPRALQDPREGLQRGKNWHRATRGFSRCCLLKPG